MALRRISALGGLLTPLHLLGDFALVGERHRVVWPLPATARFNDLVGAGLPHFSGVATYRKTFDLGGARSCPPRSARWRS